MMSSKTIPAPVMQASGGTDVSKGGIPHNVPTLKCAYDLYGIEYTDEEKKNGNAFKEKCAGIVSDLDGALKVLDETEIFLRDRLEGPLPVRSSLDIDFTKKDSVDAVVEASLKQMLGVKEDQKIEDFLQKEKGIDEATVKKIADKMRSFIKMRIILDLKKKQKLLSLKKGEREGRIEGHVSDLMKEEAKAKGIADIGRFERPAEDIHKKLTKEQVEEIRKQHFRISEKLEIYASYDKADKPFISILGFDKDNSKKTCEAVVEALKNNTEITWYNLPKTGDFRDLAEIATLQAGKRCFFEDKDVAEQTLLSKTMPEPTNGPIQWVEWLKNLEEHEKASTQPGWTITKDKQRERLVREVVGDDDPERLMEFWSDIHRDGAMPPESLKRATELLTVTQLIALENSYEKRIRELEDKAPEPPAPPLTLDSKEEILETLRIKQLAAAEDSLQKARAVFSTNYKDRKGGLKSAIEEEKKKPAESQDVKKIAKWEGELAAAKKHKEQLKTKKSSSTSATPHK
jgi:hypothetical protein